MDITISFSRGTIVRGVDTDAGMGAIVAGDDFSVAASGAGSGPEGEGPEPNAVSVFRSPEMTNTEKPGVTALKYSDVLSSPRLTVGKAFQ